MYSFTTTLPHCPRAPGHRDVGPGTSVGHYVIVSRLGGGAQGVVYKARDMKLDRLIALKFLDPRLCDDDWARERFVREARAGSAVAHPNICTIHDIASTPDGHLFIVMAWHDGQTLKEKLHHGPLEVEKAVDIAAQIAEGLAAAHARGVVHRDIKPGNLMITGHGVRILDFGLARLADSAQLTLDGTVLGTPPYMSPEQTRGEDADARSDVWSAGAVLYEMLAGRPPFRGGHAEAMCHAIRWEAPPALCAGDRDVPREVERVVRRALSKNRADRFQSALDMASALRRLQRQPASEYAGTPAAFCDRQHRDLQPWRVLWTVITPTCTAVRTAAISAAALIRSSTRTSAWSGRWRLGLPPR